MLGGKVKGLKVAAGELPGCRPHIHKVVGFPRSSFLDDKQPIHGEALFSPTESTPE
jgi:hypothetical protein